MRSMKVLVLLLAASVCAAGAVRAQDAAAAAEPEKAWSLTAGVDYSSLYIFRGVNLLGDNQEVWTPNAWLSIGNWSFYYYGYRGDFDTFPGSESYTENDFGAEYAFTLNDKVSLSLGAVGYQYSRKVEDGLGFGDTYELYAILSFDTFLSPKVTYYQDLDAVDGGYGSVGIGHSWALGEKASVDASAALGIDNKYNSGKTQLNDVLLGVNVPVTFNDHFGGHVLVQYSIALDALDEIGQGDETIVTAGLSATF